MTILYSPFRQILKLITVLIAGMIFSFNVQAQREENYSTRNFINNVVEIGLSDFGLVTAEDSTKIYFIAVRHTTAEKNNPSEGVAATIKQAKFYNGAYKAKAIKVSTAVFGAFTIVLYESPRPAVSKWQPNYYHSLSYKKGQLSTFRDKWMSDRIWSIHNAKINIVKVPKTGPVTLKVPKDAGIAKGMPLVNSDGFIAGIIAEASLGKTTIRAISMDDVATALYNAGLDCKYISMVEWGRNDTRCVLELKAKLAAAEKARLDSLGKTKEMLEQEAKDRAKAINDSIEIAKKAARKTEPKRHLIDLGINGNFLLGPLQVSDELADNYFKTRIWNAGLTVYLNIDRNRKNRITLKPRYGEFFERNDQGLWTAPDESVRIVISSYQYAELPVVFERKLFQAAKYSMAIGAGYAPGYVFNQSYTWTDKSLDVSNKVAITDLEKGIRHRLLGELYFYESGIGRLGLIYARDISDYPNANYKLDVGGIEYTPFASRKEAWYLGLEVQFRFGGKW